MKYLDLYSISKQNDAWKGVVRYLQTATNSCSDIQRPATPNMLSFTLSDELSDLMVRI